MKNIKIFLYFSLFLAIILSFSLSSVLVSGSSYPDVDEGQSISMVIEGINCSGRTLSLSYFEIDPSGSNDAISNPGTYNLPTSTTFTGTQTTVSWTAEWFEDIDGAENSDPEIQFVAECNGSQITSDVIEIVQAVVTCDLSSASWSQSSVYDGTEVELIVTGTNCAGEAIDFSIYEDDVADDLITTMSNTYGSTTTWTAQWIFPGDDDPPGIDPRSYFFVAELQSNPSESVTSGIIDVNIPNCGGGQISSMCICGGYNYSSGYCCAGNWQSSECSGDTITITDVEDTFTNINTNINSDSDQIIVYSYGRLNNDPSNPHRPANTIIMKWDLSQIPAGATVLDARLDLYQFNAVVGDPTYETTIHPIVGVNPVINQVSGYEYATGQSWSPVSSGTTFSDIPLGLADVGLSIDTAILNDVDGIKSWTITSMVQDWLDNPSNNYGLLIRPNVIAASYTETGRMFASSESTTYQTPQLVVTYDTDIDTCTDGTVYGACSVTQPLYCDDGTLVDMCSVCGCEAGYECNTQTEECEALQVCSDDTPYDECSTNKPLFCEDGSLINLCTTCGCEIGFLCNTQTEDCYEGCSDGTPYGQCSDDQPMYCNEGFLIGLCSACGCPGEQICNTANEECYILDCDKDGDGYLSDSIECGGNDCDDDPATGTLINPGMDEICDDGLDNDCNGLIDAEDTNCLGDSDGDGVPDAYDDCPDTPIILVDDPQYNPVTSNFDIISDFTDRDLRNLLGFIIGRSDSGKINFTNRIDLVPVNSSGCLNAPNMDTNMNISHNRVELNSTKLPQLNRNATITLFNLSLNFPVVMKNGEKCSLSTCSRISYENGEFVFAVTGFSVYSATEAENCNNGEITSEGCVCDGALHFTGYCCDNVYYTNGCPSQDPGPDPGPGPIINDPPDPDPDQNHTDDDTDPYQNQSANLFVSISVPESVENGEIYSASVTVTNYGDPGEFMISFGGQEMYHNLEQGGVVTEPFSFRAPTGKGNFMLIANVTGNGELSSDAKIIELEYKPLLLYTFLNETLNQVNINVINYDAYAEVQVRIVVDGNTIYLDEFDGLAQYNLTQDLDYGGTYEISASAYKGFELVDKDDYIFNVSGAVISPDMWMIVLIIVILGALAGLIYKFFV